MIASPELWIGLAIFIIATSIISTRATVARSRREEVRRRLESLIVSQNTATVETLHRKPRPRSARPLFSSFKKAAFFMHLEALHARAGLVRPLADLISTTLIAGLFPILLSFILDFPAVPALLFSIAILSGPYIYARVKAEQRRSKFMIQLPNAIDLMISVLRSGHSVPQAVRSVSEEMPDPLSQEFTEIFQRMNLGQSLSEALQNTVERFDSFELDLIRKATAIQQELGGSLSDLLEKTNETLRQRIQLKNQIKVLTAQGRLSAWICGLLPLAIAIGFSQMNPEYLQPLFESQMGQALLITALVLEFSGLLIMRKLSSFRI